MSKEASARDKFPETVTINGENACLATCRHGKASYYFPRPQDDQAAGLFEAIPSQCDECRNATEEWYRGWSEARLHTKFPHSRQRTAYCKRAGFYQMSNLEKYQLSLTGFPEPAVDSND